MLNLVKVAVTGGVSSGKSTVCRLLKDLGAYVVDSDAIVHQLLSPETESGQAVIELLGEKIVVNGRIDRSQIAAKVFDHPALLASLERILHPAVQTEIDRQFKQCQEAGTSDLFVAEVPLLYETGAQAYYDAVVVVLADDQQCRERFKGKTEYDDEEFNKRMARQLPPGKKAEKATYVILNNSSLADLTRVVKELYPKLLHV